MENEGFVLVGPLNLNTHTKVASTIMGARLPLSSKEFDTLHMLATKEGEIVEFEAGYPLDNLIAKVKIQK
ncbi:MAG: hypothetical protein LBI27_08120 [Clostridiales bacterium]|nr:hypothetical protein [Clostridiales bacterium]